MYLAIDLGGTHTKHAIIDEAGTIRSKGKTRTPATREGFCQLVQELHSASPHCERIAISSPGSVWNNAVIKGSSAVPYLKNWNMKEEIEAYTGVPVHVENDANCAGMAEAWKGAAKDARDALIVVIGTGIGGAIIRDGQIHEGAHRHGGDFGYMLLTDSVTGNDDIWSRRASTRALIRNVARQKGMDPTELTGEDIFLQADQGDDICQTAIEEFYRVLAIGLYNLQYIYDPEVILISGGISARGDLTEQIRKRVDEILSKVDLATVTPELRPAHFRQDANLIGAVYSIMHDSPTTRQH